MPKAKPSEPKSEPWKMPKPLFPMVMWYFHQPGTRLQMAECPAIVTKVYDGMLDLMVFPTQLSQGQPRSGVKHCLDPSLEKMAEPNMGGVWDFTAAERELRDLREDFMDATTAVAEPNE
jgi:hypothetical protein